MRATHAVRGIPDYGRVLDRPRLHEVMSRTGSRPLLVFGPSGCGKSVSVAQLVRHADLPSAWIDACGAPVTARQICEAALLALDLAIPDYEGSSPTSELQLADLLEVLARRPSQVIAVRQACAAVIIDDFADDSSQGCSDIADIARRLWSHGVWVIITLRSTGAFQSEALRNWGIVGPGELALSQTEAQELVAQSGQEWALDSCSDLLDECAGHVAFFVMLLSHANRGSESVPFASSTIEAWLSYVIQSELSTQQMKGLAAAAALRSGCLQQLKQVAACDAGAAVQSISAALPLVVIVDRADGSRAYRVHDLVHSYLESTSAGICVRGNRTILVAVLEILVRRGECLRAAELLERQPDILLSVSWVLEHGQELLTQGGSVLLRRLLDSVPVAEMMREPALLLLWAEACLETGSADEALAKARAARSLARHEGDNRNSYRALSIAAECLRRLNRADEADSTAEEILAAPRRDVGEVFLAEALFCVGFTKMARADYRAAESRLVAAMEVVEGVPDSGQIRHKTEQALALLPALEFGDFQSTLRRLAPQSCSQTNLLSARIMARGNVAICLTEIGRLSRCDTLVTGVIRDCRMNRLDSFLCAYLPTEACLCAGRGDDRAIGACREAIAVAVSIEDEQAADEARVYLAIILRAAGRLDESLTEAERAFERLSVNDTMQFRRLAALEVAASLLALGDAHAARTWTESVVMEGFSGNLYHALRADMILAEVERLDGDVQAAVDRLATHRDYILSENPNWQIAMYCRSFPGILGVVAAAVHPEPVPAHLLRMILPEHAEQCLQAARPTLTDAQWQDLGERLIGADEFAAYLQRDGLPLCHVRLFGGLELSIGGRAVRERDWRKRKARLLFAMLAIRRGQDVPRDQLFEYLWPEMDAERAKNNLYVVWSTMKAALVGEADKGAPCPYIESAGGVCKTVREAVRTDVDEFENLILVAREAEAAGQPSTALRAYERIADLYRGDLLPGDVYDDWFATLRDHYRSSFVDAMLRATALLMSADDPGNALIYARRAIQCDPFREDLFQAALRCQIAAGQRSSAIDTYFQCRDNLAEELGLDPSVETRALYDQILAMEDRPRQMPLDPLL